MAQDWLTLTEDLWYRPSSVTIKNTDVFAWYLQKQPWHKWAIYLMAARHANHINTNKDEKLILDNCLVCMCEILQWMPLLTEYDDSQAPSLFQSKCNMCSKDAMSKMNHHQNYNIYIYTHTPHSLKCNKERDSYQGTLQTCNKNFWQMFGSKMSKVQEKSKVIRRLPTSR